MKSLKIVFAMVLASSLLATTVSGQQDRRDHKDFNKVGFGTAGELYIKIGPSFSVVLEGDEDLLSRIETEVRGDKLVFRHRNTFYTGNNKFKAYVTMPSVEGLSISGSGRVIVESPLEGSILDLAISGSGKIISGDLKYDDLECSISGSGDFELNGAGKINNAGLSISGSGGFKAPDLELTNLDARISGSGSCDCFVTGNLAASISGSGSIYYKGNPRMDVRSSGSGRVRSR